MSTGHPKVRHLFARELRPGMIVEADGGCAARVLLVESRFPNGQLVRAVLRLLPGENYPYEIEHVLEREGASDRIVTVSTRETPKEYK